MAFEYLGIALVGVCILSAAAFIMWRDRALRFAVPEGISQRAALAAHSRFNARLRRLEAAGGDAKPVPFPSSNAHFMNLYPT